MKYKVLIEATIDSKLQAKELQEKLVISLYDLETETQINDGDNQDLEVIDYDLIKVFIGEE